MRWALKNVPVGGGGRKGGKIGKVLFCGRGVLIKE